RRGGIFAESHDRNIRLVISSGSEKSLTNQDSSSLSFLGMTAAKASKIILNIVEFLRSDLFRRGGIFAESHAKNIRIVISSGSEKSLENVTGGPG
ncbi:MAG: hypothetical protein KGY61_05630, partial [Desulfobacterales bacterium]|nr:hypothetical protein [Desulfobacterales bacterium]